MVSDRVLQVDSLGLSWLATECFRLTHSGRRTRGCSLFATEERKGKGGKDVMEGRMETRIGGDEKGGGAGEDVGREM